MALFVASKGARFRQSSLCHHDKTLQNKNIWTQYYDDFYLCSVDIVYANDLLDHYNIVTWKRFSRYWPFVRGIHQSMLHSPSQKASKCGALVCSLVLAEQNIEQTIDLPVISDDMALAWRLCHVSKTECLQTWFCLKPTLCIHHLYKGLTFTLFCVSIF